MATALHLHLPPEQDLEADAAVNAADAAELAEVENAALAVEEGDELETEEEAEEEAEAEEGSETESKGNEGQAGEPVEQQEPPPPAEPQAEAPAESPAAVPTSAIATRPPAKPPQPTALATFEFNRANAVDEYIGATLECQKLEEAYKRAKKRMEAARDALVEIENDRPDDEWEEVEGNDANEYRTEAAAVAAPVALPEAAVAAAVEEESADAPSPSPVVSDAWRSESILALNLKTTITAKLIEAGYNTIGKLEDLRADTFAGGLKSIKGIGQAKADAIEDAILNWLSKTRDAEVLAGAARGEVAKLPAAEVNTEAAADETEAADDSNPIPTAAGPLTDDAAGEALNDGDPRWFAKIEERAREILAMGDGCLDEQLEASESGGSWWTAGYEAYNANYNLIECPVVPGPERDDWIRGWLSAKILHTGGWEDAETADAESADAETSGE